MRAQMLGAALRGRGAAGAGTVSISDTEIVSEESYPDAAGATLTLQSDGVMLTDVAPARWLIGSSSGSLYEARATLVSGSSPGTTGTWLALSSNRSWGVARVSPGSKTSTFTVEIGLAGTSTAIDTATITTRATVG